MELFVGSGIETLEEHERLLLPCKKQPEYNIAAR